MGSRPQQTSSQSLASLCRLGTFTSQGRARGPRCTFRRALSLAALALLALACSSKQEPLQAAPGAYPGYEPPPLAELVQAALAKGPPEEPAEPYLARSVLVPPLSHEPIQELPVSPTGKPILSYSGGVALVVDETLSDPVTAKGACLTLVTGCLTPPTEPDPQTLDDCVASAAVCAGNQPWAAGADCCAARCQELYAALRNQSYSTLEAFYLTTSSQCFPGLKQFLEQP